MRAPPPDYEHYYYATWDPLVRTILGQLVDVARADRTPVLFVLIEHGLELSSDRAVVDRCCERQHLWKIFQEFGVDAIDLGEALSKRHSRVTVYDRMYIHHGGVPAGHFTPFGSEAAAHEIAQYIRDRFGVPLVARAETRGALPCASRRTGSSARRAERSGEVGGRASRSEERR